MISRDTLNDQRSKRAVACFRQLLATVCVFDIVDPAGRAFSCQKTPNSLNSVVVPIRMRREIVFIGCHDHRHKLQIFFIANLRKWFSNVFLGRTGKSSYVMAISSTEINCIDEEPQLFVLGDARVEGDRNDRLFDLTPAK